MSDPVRVRDNATGHEYSTYSPSDGETRLDEPAVDMRGELIPAKPSTRPAQPPAPTTTGRKATTEEN